MRTILLAAASAGILCGLAGNVLVTPALAAPSKEDFEKAMNACPANTEEGSDGMCWPKKAGRMGFDYALPDDNAAPAKKPAARTASDAPKPAPAMRRVASDAPMPVAPVSSVNLQLTFAKASWVMSQSDKATARAFAEVMLEPRNVSKHMAIEGHTDSSGNADSNMILSKKRAEAVKDYLVSLGIESSRLTAEGFGSTQPINAANPAAAENRRVVARRVQ